MTPPRPRPSLETASPAPLPSADRASVLRLDLNENQWGPSPRALAAARRVLDAPVDAVAAYGFPDRLRGRLAARLGVPPEAVFVTAGADEAIAVLFRAYVAPGDRVVLARPTFVTFELECQVSGAAVEAIDHDDELRVPLDAYAAAVRREPRLAVVVNPNNPTGATVPVPWIRRIAAAAPATLVVVDEAYGEYHGESLLDAGPPPDNVVVLRTFSKAYGLAGLRVGYAVGHPDLVAQLAKARPPFALASASLAAAEAALDDEAHLRAHVATLRAEMDRLAGRLRAGGLRVRTTRASFVLVETPSRADEVARRLAARGILVSPRHKDRGLERTLRVTVGRPEQNDRLADALLALGRRAAED